MAEASMSNKLIDDFLTCQICFEVFKDPKILACLHSFCLKCITKLHSGSTSAILKCPLCKTEVTIPKAGISDLKTNFYISNLCDVVNAKEINFPRKYCSFCAAKDESTLAVYRCLECQDTLCETCAGRHNFTRITLKHRVINLEGIRSGKFDDQMRSLQTVECQTHKKEVLRYFCETCDIPVCRDCVILLHRTHNFVSVEEALQSAKEDIRNLISGLDKSLKNSKDEEHKISSKLSEIEQNEKQELVSVTCLADQIITKVRLEETKVREKLDKLYAKPKIQIKDKIKDSKKISEPIKESLEFCKSVLRNGKEIEILFLQELLQNRLVELQRSSSNLKSPISNFTLPSVKLNSSFEAVLDIFEFSDSSPDLGKDSSRIQKGEIVVNAESMRKSTRNGCILRLTFVRNINCATARCTICPKLTSVAWIDNAKFAVSDNNNNIIKLFDLVGSIKVTNPVTMTYCNNTIVCFSASALHLITAEKHIFTVAMLNGNRIYPVTSKGNNFFVGNIEKGKITEYSGRNVVRTVSVKHAIDAVFDHPFSLCVTSKEDIIISDKTNTAILVIGKDGMLKKHYKCDDSNAFMEPWEPGAVTVDKYDNIFSTFYHGSKLVVISSKDDKVDSSNFDKKVIYPRSLAISSNDNLLVSGSGEYVSLFKVKYVEGDIK